MPLRGHGVSVPRDRSRPVGAKAPGRESTFDPRIPVRELRTITWATRKIGLGVMGLAQRLAALGIPYDSDETVRLAGRLMGASDDRPMPRQNGSPPSVARIPIFSAPWTHTSHGRFSLWRNTNAYSRLLAV